MTKQVSYFQFQKQLGYPVFVRFEDEALESSLETLIISMGFSKLEESEFKKIEIINSKTRILGLNKATLKVARQIDGPGPYDSYGPESTTEFSAYDVYRYKNFGLILCRHNSALWEAGIKNCGPNSNELKTIITRFISLALAPFGIITFWGVPVNEGFVIMKPKDANFESIIVDVDNRCFISQDGVVNIDFETKILRLDESLHGRTKQMSKEELVSFLSTKTCYLSNKGLDHRIRESIYSLAKQVEGVVYPVENFKPRAAA